MFINRTALRLLVPAKRSSAKTQNSSRRDAKNSGESVIAGDLSLMQRQFYKGEFH
jgi:hypothetical protein